VSRRLPLAEKLLFGFGQTAYGAKLQSMGLILLFYSQIKGVPAAWVSLAVSATMFVNAVWDPLIGQASDTLETRWGRRHPLLYAAALPLGVAFAMLWAPPQGLGSLGLALYLLASLLLLRLFGSLYELASSALLPELAPDYDERTVLVSWRFVFQTVGRAAAAFLSFGVFLRATKAHPTGQLNPDGYGPMGLSLGALMTFAVLVCALATHREIPRLHRPARRARSLGRTLRDMATALKNWNFGVAVLAGLTAAMANGLNGGLYVYIATFVWELPAHDIFQLVGVELVSAPIAAALAPALARRFGKKAACMALFFASVATNNGPLLLRLLGLFPDNHSALLMPLLLADRAVSGVFGTGGFIVVTSMIADIVEDSQARTGRRSEGLLLSANSLLNQVGMAAAAVLPGLLLALVGFPTGAQPGHVDPAVLSRLGWLFLPLSAGSSLVSISVWAFYRIDRAAHERNLLAGAMAVVAGESAPDLQATRAPRSTSNPRPTSAPAHEPIPRLKESP
jgi:Na+/melibiose symporter-like transporter